MAEFARFRFLNSLNLGRVLVFKWKNWIGAAASVALLTVSSCASWTPEQKEYTAVGAGAARSSVEA